MGISPLRAEDVDGTVNDAAGAELSHSEVAALELHVEEEEDAEEEESIEVLNAKHKERSKSKESQADKPRKHKHKEKRKHGVRESKAYKTNLGDKVRFSDEHKHTLMCVMAKKDLICDGNAHKHKGELVKDIRKGELAYECVKGCTFDLCESCVED